MRQVTAATVSLALVLLSPPALPSALADEAQALATLAKLHNDDLFTRDIESDGADRIRLAHRLAMLTQMVPAASCALTSDVAVKESYLNLEEAMHEIDIILHALQHGNDALHIIGPELKPRTLHDLKALDQEWRETHGAVEAVLIDGHDVDSAHLIDDHNLKLLDLANTLVSDMTGQYSHPYEISQEDAMLISIAGRQKMLTQKMSKDACEIWTHYHEDSAREDLEQTMVIFENSLKALRFGLPSVGIKAAPTDQIKADLDELLAHWAVIDEDLKILLAEGDLPIEKKQEIVHELNYELAALDHLINDYKVYVSRHH